MTVGGFMIAGAFVISMFVQLAVNKTLPPVPSSNEIHVQFLNNFPCQLRVTPNGVHGLNASILLSPNETQSKRVTGITYGEKTTQNLTWDISGVNCPGVAPPASLTVPATTGKAYFLSLAPGSQAFNTSRLKKSQAGEGQFVLSLTYQTQTDFPFYGGSFFWCRQDEDNPNTCFPRDGSYFKAVALKRGQSSAASDIKPATWRLYYPNITSIPPNTTAWWSRDNQNTPDKSVSLSSHWLVDTGYQFTLNDQGGIYMIAISTNSTGGIQGRTLKIAERNTISILWQVPQYVVVTAAEILFSVTGLEFSYSQAPLSMKSVVGALWLLTNAVGDLLVLAIELSNAFTNLAWEQLCFAIIMVVVMVIFMLLSIFWYEYGHFLQHEEDDEDEEELEESFSEKPQK